MLIGAMAALLIPLCVPLWVPSLLAVAQAQAPTVALSSLTAQPEQAATTRLITQLIDRYHYKKAPLDDALSREIYRQYLLALDPARTYFSARDVRDLDRYRNALDEAMETGQMTPAYAMFRRYRERVDERLAYALQLLDRPLDLTRDERYLVDRSEADWPADRTELDELWHQRVKHDVLSLKLTGKDAAAIRDTLRRRYQNLGLRVRQINADDVYQMFINAYTAAIEPHTAYMPPRASENFEIGMSLSLEGIGAVLQVDNEYTVVRSVVPGGPADLSGFIKPDDRIVGVGEGATGELIDVIGWRLDEVVDLIRGPKGSVVRVQVLPATAGLEDAPKVITITREKIKLEEQAAKKSLLELGSRPGDFRVGVIEVPAFYLDFAGRRRGDPDYRSTTRDVRRLIDELRAEQVDALIVDLRDNGGGSLDEATQLTGLFIRSGPVVMVKETGGRVETYEDSDTDVAWDGPLAVLVNRYSASASEIFAGAIQDYRRGLIVGEATFGKGTVQTLVDLDQEQAGKTVHRGQLKTTFAQFFRVNGASTQHRGVAPDIIFPLAHSSEPQGERALDNALPWAGIAPARYRPWTAQDWSLDGLRARHLVRVAADPGFEYLLEKTRADLVATEQKTVSLLESRRRAQRAADREQELVRRNVLRLARGLEALERLPEPEQGLIKTGGADDPKAVADEDELGDVLLRETGHILADYAQQSGPAPLLQAAEAAAARSALP